MLRNQIVGKNDSWAIRWYASAFINDKLTLYPGKSLLANSGNDLSGTNCLETAAWNVTVSQSEVNLSKIYIVSDIII
jgi:hypothetical protein